MKVKNFITENFMLQSSFAQELYHTFAQDLPIIDYHNHLSPKKIARNKPLKNITIAWLKEDHYKWRAMRANGVDEIYITSSASSHKEKFIKWAKTVPKTLRNPLFHWTHLELKRYFNIDELLTAENAERIYEKANAELKQKTPRQLLKEMKVEVICTTDDPIDSLQYHQELREQNLYTKVLPTFRSDNLFLIENSNFITYIKGLARAVNFKCNDLESLLNAIDLRIDFFEKNGCKLSDYGINGAFNYVDFSKKEVDIIFKKRIKKESLSELEIAKFKSCLLLHLAKKYYEKNWVQQYHLGALRNNNNRLQKLVGADAGSDSITDVPMIESLSKFLNTLNSTNQLAKTITYNLNPAQNETFAAMIGNFQNSDYPGKMQWGSAWWFLDQKDGIEKQLNCLSNIGLISNFIGMLTDSRSLLSFPRHEYFRRILCNVIGDDVEKGLLPKDLPFLGNMIQDICYYNAKNYFNFNN